MPRLSRTRRLVIAALAIAQMAVPALVAIADAELAARAGGTEQVHIEDHGRRSCRPAHADDCALCQHLSHLAPERTPAAFLSGSTDACLASFGDALRVDASFVRALTRSRAPPTIG